MPVRRQKVIQAAEKLVQRGRLEAAIGEYRKVLRDEPNDTRTLNRVGDLYLRLERVDEAVDLFNRAAAHFSREGFFVKAIAIYKKIIRVDPTRIRIYESLADLYHRQGLLNEARSQYQVVADYHSQRGDVEAVIEINRKMTELDPGDPAQRLKLADLYLQRDMRAEATEQYRRIAELMVAHDRAGEATRFYIRAFELDATDMGLLTDAVLGLKEKGHGDAALELLEAAVELNPAAEKVRSLTGLSPAPAPEAARPAESAPTGEEPREPAAEEVFDLESLTRLTEPVPPEPPVGEEAAPPDFDESDVVVLDLDAAPSPVEQPPAEAAQEIEFEIELEELDRAPAAEAEEAPAAPAEAVPADASDLSAEAREFLRGPELAHVEEAERSAELAEQALELMAEAQVLAAYGLDDKAIERFSQVLEIEPANLEAYRRLIELHVHEGRVDDVIASFERAREAVPETEDTPGWDKITDLLVQENYRLEGGRLEPPPIEPEPPLVEAEAPPIEPEPPLIEAEAPPIEPEAAAAPEPPEAVVTAAPEPAEVAPEPAAAEPPVAAEPPAAAEPAAVAEAPADAASAPVEESAITWLENLQGDAGVEKADSEAMFGEEEEFFDLAAELEEELREEEKKLGAEAASPMAEQSLEEIVAGFKQGVAETLSKEDYDTHYNLGIAYREMGLLDEAIGEFQLAAKDPRYLVDCCSLLGASFFEKGFGDLAIKWYGRGLESPEITEDETLGLLYEMGNLHLAMGHPVEARRAFIEIYGVNSNYRDVVAKLEELRDVE